MKKVVIAGAGVMGASIAQVYAKAGYETVVYDLAEEFLTKGEDLIKINQENLIRGNMIGQEESWLLMSRIRYTTQKQDFSDASVIVESIIEKMEIKLKFWEEVSLLADENALLVSNTSGLSISGIAQAVHLPGRFAGQHWLNPPHLVPVCELIAGEKTEESTMEALCDLVRALDKIPVKVKDIKGFITNRLQFALLREAINIVEQGAASMEDVDNVVKYGLGMRYACLGPFETADLGGLDTFDNISSYLFEDLSDLSHQHEWLHGLAQEGKLGVKSGQGFYDYSDGRDKEVIKRRDGMLMRLAAVYEESK